MCLELKTHSSKLTAKTKASATSGGLCRFRLRLLRRGLAGGFGLAGVRFVELAAEALNAAGGIDQLLLAGEERVAGGADFDDDVALVRGAGFKAGSAGALDVDALVLRVNSFFWHVPILFLIFVCLPACGSLATVEPTSHRNACRAAAYAPVRERSGSTSSLSDYPDISKIRTRSIWI